MRSETEEIIPPDIEKQKKINRKLAIVIGLLGLGVFSAVSALFVLMIIFKPGLLIGIMPVQSFTASALSDGSRTYLLVRKSDMSNYSFKDRQAPQEKNYFSVLQGTELTPPKEIPDYGSAAGSNNQLVLFSERKYRSYDGTRWTEVMSDSIGQDPIGTATPDGLYVLSGSADTEHLCLIRDNQATAIPLPDQFLHDWKESFGSSPRMVRFQGRPCLFWRSGDSVVWTVWSGSSWLPSATSPFTGDFQVISDENRLYFFHREGTDRDSMLNLYVFENNEWTGPRHLPIPNGFIEWSVFMQQGRPMLFVQQPSYETLYTVEQGALANPVRIEGTFGPMRILGRLALIAACVNLVIFFIVSCFSALIRHYKDRHRSDDGAQYEFASLLRRFTAYFLDNLFLLIPPAIIIALLMNVEDLSAYSLQALPIASTVLSIFVYYFLGGFLYRSLLEGLFGATLGKKICGLIVLKSDFTSCSTGAGFLRNVMRLVDAFFSYLIAVIAISGTLKWQRLGDLAADTVVVRKKKAVVLTENPQPGLRAVG
jgi:uncharacterized RDD family membrane protein YckC